MPHPEWLDKEEDELWGMPLVWHMRWDILDSSVFTAWGIAAVWSGSAPAMSIMIPISAIAVASFAVPILAVTVEIHVKAYTNIEIVIDLVQIVTMYSVYHKVGIHESDTIVGILILSSITSFVDLIILKGPYGVRRMMMKLASPHGLFDDDGGRNPAE